MLCQGMSRTSSTWQNGAISNANRIPGLVAAHPNEHVETLKGYLWQQILNLLGKDGNSIMADLLLDCGVFVPLDKSLGTFYQLSGGCKAIDSHGCD